MSYIGSLKIKNKAVLHCAVFIFSFFTVLASEGHTPGAVIAAVSFTGAVFCFVFYKRGNRLFCTAAAALALAVAGAVFASGAKAVYYYPSQRFLEKYADTECSMTLHIDKIDSKGGNYANYNCSILSCNGIEAESVLGIYPGLRLNCFGGDFPREGDVVLIKSKVTVPEKKTKNGFEEAAYLRSRHIFMNCDYSGEMVLLEKGSPKWVDSFRERLSSNLTGYIGDVFGTDEAALAKCMLLGDRSGISDRMKAEFASAGVSHVLSVSGLHLSILFMTMSVLFGLGKKTDRRRFPGAEIFSCILIFMYMAVADFTASIMRAGFMHIFMNLFFVLCFYQRRFAKRQDAGCLTHTDEEYSDKDGLCHGRKVKMIYFDTLSSLFLAGAVICIISPYSVFDVGMQLSFMSTLGILIGVGVLRDFERRIPFVPLRAVFVSFFITFTAVSFTFPVCVYSFGELSVMSALSNLLITPLMTPLLALLLLLALASSFPQSGSIAAFCSVIGEICEWICGICLQIVRYGSGFLFSVVQAKESILIIAVFAVLAVFTLAAVLVCHRKATLYGFFAMICFYFVYITVSFVGTVREFYRPRVNFCTVNKRPYFCVMVGNTRIIADDTSGLASQSILEGLLGDALYDMENIYLVLTGRDSDLESTYFNISSLEKNEKVDTVLIPSIAIAERSGVDMTEYSGFAEKLGNHGFRIAFYNGSFTFDNTAFTAELSPDIGKLTFDDVCVIFAGEYDEELADKASEGLKYCICYCDKAQETDNNGYNSGAKLYISSPLYKNVNGALQIPVRKPALLE